MSEQARGAAISICTKKQNHAHLINACPTPASPLAASGGALVHAGVMEEISDTAFEGNAAGNEGPAVLSLGLLSSMEAVTFDGNDFYCEEGEFGTETQIDKDLLAVR